MDDTTENTPKEPLNNEEVLKSYDKKARLQPDIHSVLDAKISDDSHRGNVLYDYFHKKDLLKYLKPAKDDIVLDFGTGVGRLSSYISPLVKEVVGIDRSSEMIKVAKSNKLKQDNIEYIHINDHHIPKPDNYFNKLFSFQVFSSISNKLLKEILPELFRVMKHGGELVYFEQVEAKSKYEGNIHKKRTIEEYLELSREAGFTVVSCDPIMRIPSYSMGIWKKYRFIPRGFLPFFYFLNRKTMFRKPENVVYFTYTFKCIKI